MTKGPDGKLTVPLNLPDFREYAVPAEPHGATKVENTHPLGELLRDIYVRNSEAANFRLFCPDETNSNRLGAVFVFAESLAASLAFLNSSNAFSTFARATAAWPST